MVITFFTQDRGDSTRGKRDKIYEHLKKEIDLRAKRKPTKDDLKNQVILVCLFA